MIKIIPSINIIGGKCIKLNQGDFNSEKIYYHNPLDVAKKFEDHGIEQIHLVDLDGSKKMTPMNYHVLETIAGHTNLKINYAGGIHNDGDVIKVLEFGASTITAASIAALKKENFASWIISYGREKITLGADAYHGQIRVKGWQKQMEIDLYDHISYFYNRSLKYLKVTDISKDGLMQGPSFELYQNILTRFPDVYLIASGGVRSMEDIERLQEMGVHAVVFGRAFYEGKIKLEELHRILV